MEIAERREGDVTVLALTGRLDGGSDKELLTRAGAIIDAGARKMVLDCAGLEYVSSSGLRTLLLILRRLKAVNGSFAIGALCEQVRQVLEMTGFAPHLSIHFSAADAVRDLTANG